MILVIGYGNSLRNDDGVGQHIAREIDAQGWPGVRSVALAQLMPELAEDLSKAELTFFVDADVRRQEGPGSVEVTEIDTDQSPLNSSMHSMTPEGLLMLAKALYGRCPPARLVSVPVHNIDLGDTLSPQALQGAEMAIHLIGLDVVRQRGA